MLTEVPRPPAVELAPGRFLLPLYNREGAHVAYIDTHPHRETGYPCQTVISLATAATRARPPHRGPFWTIVQADPLSLTPALNCPVCDNYGWVTAGKWATQ